MNSMISLWTYTHPSSIAVFNSYTWRHKVISTLNSLKLRSSLNFSSFPHHSANCLYSPFSVRGRSILCCVSIQAVDRGAVAGIKSAEDFPPKLKEILKLFETVSDPRAKYEQLLHYAKKLKPLALEFRTKENKVEGCVSQVWVRATLQDNDEIYFEAESDSVLTKGLAALLVEGLSGSTVSQIVKTSPDFIHLLGLKQSLTPSRSNGFFNMFKLMQKKALQLYMQSESEHSSGPNLEQNTPTSTDVSVTPTNGAAAAANVVEAPNHTSSEGQSAGSRKERITKILEEALMPKLLEVEDVSHEHAGHAGIESNSRETHFNVKVISSEFEGRSLLKRHRLVYDLLQDELMNGLHALSIVAKTPSEVELV